MNPRRTIGTILSLSLLLNAHGQATFVYDQQSSTESNTGEGAPGIQLTQPLGQSFTPTLSQVAFVRLWLSDATFGNGLGAAVFVNLCANSVTGSVIAVSVPVSMPDNFSGFRDFFFSAPAAVTPEQQYFFRVVVQTGDLWQVASGNTFGYNRGTAYFNGVASSTSDLWFREGVLVPEPSPSVLLFLGLCAFAARRRWSS